jgi:phosphoglycolate phosphatase-like HAD superfamily hydrolase
VTSKLKAIVFDFDGVILESAGVKTEAFCALYQDHGPDVVAQVRAHHLANLGVSRFKKFEWIAANVLGRPLSEAESAALGERFTALAFQRVLEVPFVPGAREALAQLGGRFSLFVASGTPQDELDEIVRRRGLAPSFREVHGTPREKPAILRDILRRHAWSCEQILFVGDGLTDHNAARETGVAFLARDTLEVHDRWLMLGVVRRPDLVDLPTLVEAWA